MTHLTLISRYKSIAVWNRCHHVH